MNSLKGQLTPRALIIGGIGSAIITASSLYIALKIGALPWPIVFAAIVSLFILKIFGHTNLNEANVTHTAMSAGSMVAGGLAFTIPGIWILDPSYGVEMWQLVAISLSGTVLGLVFMALMRKRFIEDDELDYPIGEAAAASLVAYDEGGRRAKQLFGAMGVTGVYTVIRDWFGLLPTMFFGNVSIPGIAFGIYNSPMLLAVGFLVGTSATLVWFLGSLLGNFGIVLGGSAAGLWDIAGGQAIRSSLGMGCMIGCGVAVVIKSLMSLVKSTRRHRAGGETGERALKRGKGTRIPMASALAAVAVVICFVLDLGPIPAVIVVALTWLTTIMSAQSVGETGINPMEIFGVLVLLVVAALGQVPEARLFFVAAVVAVACGLVGDVMNDYRAGHILGTSHKAQWIAQAVGGIIGAIVAAAVLFLLVHAYGTGAFGAGRPFVAAQAEVVATMVSGIPNLPAFFIGLALCAILYLAGLPVITLGIGIYLPFYMSFTAFIGLLAKLVFQRLHGSQVTGTCLASGVLGGESIVGVLLALVGVFLM